MSNTKTSQIRTLDEQFKSYQKINTPKEGWIRAIRTSLSMPMSYVAKKLAISPQGVKGLEKSEEDETISIKSLKKAAKALDCQLHYVLVPENKSLQEIIFQRVNQVAEDVEKFMSLPDKKNEGFSKEKLIKDLISNPNYQLWE